MFYIINQVLHFSLNFYPLMKLTRVYLSLAKMLEIVEFPRGDELKQGDFRNYIKILSLQNTLLFL